MFLLLSLSHPESALVRVIIRTQWLAYLSLSDNWREAILGTAPFCIHAIYISSVVLGYTIFVLVYTTHGLIKVPSSSDLKLIWHLSGRIPLAVASSHTVKVDIVVCSWTWSLLTRVVIIIWLFGLFHVGACLSSSSHVFSLDSFFLRGPVSNDLLHIEVLFRGWITSLFQSLDRGVSTQPGGACSFSNSSFLAIFSPFKLSDTFPSATISLGEPRDLQVPTFLAPPFPVAVVPGVVFDLRATATVSYAYHRSFSSLSRPSLS